MFVASNAQFYFSYIKVLNRGQLIVVITPKNCPERSFFSAKILLGSAISMLILVNFHPSNEMGKENALEFAAPKRFSGKSILSGGRPVVLIHRKYAPLCYHTRFTLSNSATYVKQSAKDFQRTRTYWPPATVGACFILSMVHLLHGRHVMDLQKQNNSATINPIEQPTNAPHKEGFVAGALFFQTWPITMPRPRKTVRPLFLLLEKKSNETRHQEFRFSSASRRTPSGENRPFAGGDRL